MSYEVFTHDWAVACGEQINENEDYRHAAKKREWPHGGPQRPHAPRGGRRSRERQGDDQHPLAVGVESREIRSAINLSLHIALFLPLASV
jgi:hypothetical protein